MRRWLAVVVGLGVAADAAVQTAARGGRVSLVVEGPYRDEAVRCEAMREDDAGCHEPTDEDGASVCGCVESGPTTRPSSPHMNTCAPSEDWSSWDLNARPDLGQQSS